MIKQDKISNYQKYRNNTTVLLQLISQFLSPDTPPN